MRVKKLFSALTIIIFILVCTAIGFYRWIEHNRNLCFYQHLSSAIKINRQRKLYYSRKSEGQSVAVSDQLIDYETKVLPIALSIDFQVQRFLREGIPIICNDFIDMTFIRSQEDQPLYHGVAGKDVFADLAIIFENTKQKMRNDNHQMDFRQISQDAYQLLQDVERREHATGSNFCMSKHVIESLGLASLHAQQYSKLSSGRTRSVSKAFIDIKISGISNTTLEIDREAQTSHQRGIGIICNDVPKIPFPEEFLELTH